jgi:hypothetical protein
MVRHKTYKSEVASNGMMLIQSLMKIREMTRTHTHTHTLDDDDDAINLRRLAKKVIVLCYENNVVFPRSKNLSKPKNNCDASISERSRTKYLHRTHHQTRPPEAP